MTATVLVALAIACAHAGAASAAPSYHSPGYAGKTKFGANLTPKALPSIVLGTGKYPNLFVDNSGTAHIVFANDGGTSAPDTFSVCNLQRGIKQCATSGTVPAPAAPEPVVAESVLVKQQLLILNRSRKRSPNLRLADRLVAGV